jgi:hypothetical protein
VIFNDKDKFKFKLTITPEIKATLEKCGVNGLIDSYNLDDEGWSPKTDVEAMYPGIGTVKATFDSSESENSE